MRKFSEAFEAARTAMASDASFVGVVKTMQPKLKQLLGPNGPDAAQAEQLDRLRFALKKGSWEFISTQHLSADKAGAKWIITAAGTAAKKQERAATVKMLRHLYHITSAGAQQIWVYSPPKAYTKWIFDEVAGATDTALETVIAKEAPEVYTETQHAIMADAVQVARAIALEVVAKLGGKTIADATKAVVKRYFADATTKSEDLPAIMSSLKGGYQRIANACNGCSVVISDEPLDRNGPGWEDWAFIYPTEKMGVIYLQKAWLDKAGEASPSNAAPLYRCARTIIHELSHKAVKTEDVVYGPKGLKPEGSTDLKAEYALHNADSWAYFAIDVTGKLTGPDAANGTKVCTAIRLVPTHVLETA